MTEERQEAEEREQQQQLDQIRTSVGRGVAFIQSVAFGDHLGDLTFNAAIARAVTTIEEDESEIRPGKINALNALKADVSSAVETALNMPGELFAIESEEEEEE